MIKIEYSGKDAHGISTYTIQVNKQHICRFEHNHLDGLADCLQKAADAVELSDWADSVLLDEVKGG